MSRLVTDKKLITSKILDLIQPDWNKDDLYNAQLYWWMNRRKGGGLALTDAGLNAFTIAGLEFWEETSDDPYLKTSAAQLKMDKCLHSPYHITKSSKNRITVRIYDSRIATVIGLYGGFVNYLANLKSGRDE